MELFWLPAVLGLAYVLLCGYTFLMQDRLLYYPDPRQPTIALLASAGLEEWPAGNDAFRGYVSSRTGIRQSGVILVFHGNAGAAWHRNYYVEFLKPFQIRVLLAEYPGYGGRPGELGEMHFVQDALETLRLVRAEFDGPLYICGESLGAGVAAAVAANSPSEVDGLVLITPWDSLVDLAKKHYWYLPVRWLARDRYDNLANLARFTGPVAVVVAERDEIVPMEHGLKLFESLKAPKRLWTVKGASHNTWTHFLISSMWEEIVEFLHQNPKKSRPRG